MSTTLEPVVRKSTYTSEAPPKPPVTPATAPKPQTKERLLSLDVFRGMTVAGMLLVNNPGTWAAIYPPLEHAEWNGWTPTDLIFPFFLFIVGITTHLSLQSRRARGDSDSVLVKQILRRGAIIYLLGFLMAAFPFYQYGTIEGMTNPSLWDKIVYRAEHVRIMGVLARIGVVYIFAALLTLKTTLKQQVVIVAALLYGYWFAMTLIPIPGKDIGALMLNNPAETLAALRRPLDPDAEPHLVRQQDLRSRRNSLDLPRDRHRHTWRHDWPMDRTAEVADRADCRPVRGRMSCDGRRDDVELVVPDQQESLDELVCRVHRRHGLRDAGDDHVADR